MNKKTLFYIVAANLVLLLLLAIVYPHLMVEPGKLINAHESLETDCFACHTPFIGSRPAKCVQCHKPAEIGLVTTKGLSIAHERKLTPFHQDLIEQDCVACHSDRKGVQSFRPIGQFSHDLLEANLRGECNGCHRHPGDSLHREITANCGQCHSQQSWTPATLDHERFFRFDQDHQTACATCHVDQDFSRYTCYGCHEHSRSNIRAEHVEEGIEDYENCVECHRSGDAEEGEGDEHEGRNADIGTLRSQTRQDLWERSRGKQDNDDEPHEREDDD